MKDLIKKIGMIGVIIAVVCGYSFVEDSITLSAIYTVSLLTGFLIYMKILIKPTFLNLVSFLPIISYTIVYFTTRMIVGSMRGDIMTMFNLDASSWALFISVFSLGYGAMQFVTGFILNKTGPRGAGIFAVLFGVSLILTSMQTNVTGLLICRLFNGIFASAGSIGLAFYLSTYWPNKVFNGMINTSMFLGIKVAALTSGVVGVAITAKQINSMEVLRYMGYIVGIIGIIIFLVLNVIKPINKNQTSNHEPEKSLAFTEVLKTFFQDKLLVLLAIYSISAVCLYYVLQDGSLVNIVTTFHPAVADINVLNNFYNNIISVGSVVLPILLMFVSAEIAILIASVCQFGGTIVFLMFCKTSIALASVGLFGVAFGGLAHTYAPLIVGERYTGNITGVYFGIFNFCAMMIGCTLAQGLQGPLLKHLSIGRDISSALPTSYMVWGASSVLSLIVGVVIFFNRSKQNA